MNQITVENKKSRKKGLSLLTYLRKLKPYSGSGPKRLEKGRWLARYGAVSSTGRERKGGKQRC